MSARAHAPGPPRPDRPGRGRGITRTGRSVVLAIVLSTVPMVALPGTLAPARATGEPERPNILIILTDDQRLTRTMRVMPATRRIFGRGGTSFTHAFATTPLCCPSRATIFTGRYAHNHGVQRNRPGPIFDQSTTMQRYLQEGGYRTGIFGKYFNHWDLQDAPPYFDRWAIDSPTQSSPGYYGGTWNVQGNVRTVSGYSTDFIARHGVRYISSGESHDTRPWFLELAPFAPHEYAQPEPAYADAAVPVFRDDPAMRERDRSDKPPFVRKESAPSLDMRAAAAARQLRTLMSVDDLVKSVFDELKLANESRDTLAFFLSDNGACWGEHGLIQKEVAYPCSSRVPFFIRWPGHVDAGAHDGGLIGTVDIAPTVYEVAGVTPEVTPDGRSLLQAWTRDRILLEFWRVRIVPYPTWASTMTDRYQYVEEYRDDGQVSFREYYDLASDPWELANLFHDGDPTNDPAVAPLRRQLAADRICSGTACP